MRYEDLLRDLQDRLAEWRMEDVNHLLLMSHWTSSKEIRALSQGDTTDLFRRVVRYARIPEGYEEWLKKLEGLKPPIGLAKVVRMYRTKTRLLVGSGLSAWEISLIRTLHPFTVPWVPGSSLKGVMEWAALGQLIEEGLTPNQLVVDDSVEKIVNEDGELEIWRYKELDLKEMKDPLRKVAEIFGTKKFRGRLIALGGFPIPRQGSLLTLDVLTPHYRRYYESGGAVAPHEFMDPVPVRFLAVREGVVFKFILLVPERDVERASGYLDTALTREGVGGKTSAGYGVFEPVSPGESRPRRR